MTHTTRPFSRLSRGAGLGLLLLLAGCGRDATVTPFKTPGVGLDPGTIGPEPALQNGLFELNRVEFAGGGLPLALLGLVSYQALDATGSADPPYAVVSGQGFVSEAPQPRMDVLFGTIGVPLDRPGTCYTQYEPRAFLSSLVDVGDHIAFEGEGFSMRIGRRPVVYPKNNMEQIRPYYSDFAPWRPHAVNHAELGEDDSLADARETVLMPANWRPGATVNLRFPGGLPPEEATFGAIPMPLAATGNTVAHPLPQDLPDMMVAWSGPAYSLDPATGAVGAAEEDQVASSAGVNQRCLQFAETTSPPGSPEGCASAPWRRTTDAFGQEVPVGQLYTGPWETEDGVGFAWEPLGGGASSGTLVVGVRILGPVDFDDEYKRVAQVDAPATTHLRERYSVLDDAGLLAEGESLPDAVPREALACEAEADGTARWDIDPSLLDASGAPVLGLQGEPSRVLAEVICNVPDDGLFVLTPEMVQDALDYGDQNGAAGAIFYVARTTASDLDTPDVRDRYGQRRPAEPVRVTTSTARFGRFYWNR